MVWHGIAWRNGASKSEDNYEGEQPEITTTNNNKNKNKNYKKRERERER